MFLGIENRESVRVIETFSNWAAFISGIPQGSILGPLLFIIYINDLVEYCNSGSEIYLFADDAKIFSYVSNARTKITISCNKIKINLRNGWTHGFLV